MRQFVGTSLDGAGNQGTSRTDGRKVWGGAAIVLLIVACASPANEARSDDEPGLSEQVAAGRELFLRQWKTEDRLFGSSDGLGPLYNAASCVKCHALGGIGGAGANDENVDLVTLRVPRNVVVAGNDLTRRVAAFHPALAAGQLSATTVLHRFSSDPTYDAWRKRFFSPNQHAQLPLARIVAVTTAASKHPLKATNPIQRLDGMAYQHSQRNTPALFGAGMIDRLPESVFDEIQVRQAEKSSNVSGRVSRTATGRVGRFGWRGQTESLHEFVLGACAVELGLEAPRHSQPIDPLDVRFDDSGRPVRPIRGGLDISDEQCKSLTQFVAHLPPPRQLTPTDDLGAQTIARGEKQFAKIGCADCHVQQVADVAGVYSDLLLHDMGEGLEDPVPANPAQGSPGSASYYGGADSLLVKVPPELRREWRTPPLWGVRDSAPYLHDGRAQTFAEAIAWHGGEAAKSARAFRRLTEDEKEEVLAFLNCLAAPTPESLEIENVALVGTP
jgi:CxxC motif-containing protein (DUF1111 family)